MDLTHMCLCAQLENISYELYNSRISVLWRFGNESMSEFFFFKYHLISCCLDIIKCFCDYSTKMPGFQHEFGGSVSASISSTTVLYTICFRLLHFLSEKISAFLRMISHSAVLMFYLEMAQTLNRLSRNGNYSSNDISGSPQKH